MGWSYILNYCFNTALVLDKRHPLTTFHSEVHKTTSNKQTRSFYARSEIKTTQCSNFLSAIIIRVPWLSLPQMAISLFIPKEDQTRSFYAKNEIKTTQCSAIFISVAESISWIINIQNNLFRILPHIFYESYTSPSACKQWSNVTKKSNYI